MNIETSCISLSSLILLFQLNMHLIPH